ncbi:uncharacterized protein LOC127059599 isoform X30 [Serinus canaria]|uniref:uncharacterized protein LOC127059599 isoform X30 n=1 Tax=Serinus canaria TaxID=9135 RepID=UPI0021CCE7AB|nr:uncharacterized protein LOC127059599 isoform X30 [Serinus canaria]
MEAVVSSSRCPCCSFLLILFPCLNGFFPCVLLPQGAVLQERLLQGGSPTGSQQTSCTTGSSPRGFCQEPDPVWASPRGSSGNIPLAPSRAPSQAAGGSLLHPGLLPRLQVDPCFMQGSFPGCRWISAPSRAPSQAAGGSLLHPGLLPRLQVHLCSIQGSFPGCRWIPASCRAPSQAASASLLHPGLLPKLQVHLCSIVDPHGLQGAPPVPPSSLPLCLQGCSSPISHSSLWLQLLLHLQGFSSLPKSVIPAVHCPAGYVLSLGSAGYRGSFWHLLPAVTPAAPPKPDTPPVSCRSQRLRFPPSGEVLVVEMRRLLQQCFQHYPGHFLIH